MTFAEKMILAQSHYDWSPVEMAEQLRVPVEVIQGLESGKMLPDGDFIERISLLTGTNSSDWLNNEVDLPRLPSYNLFDPPTLHAKTDEEAKRYRLRKLISHFDQGEQRSFAERIGLREDFLSKMLSEKSREKITNRTLIKIAKHTGASFEWLSSGVGPWLKSNKNSQVSDHEGRALKQYLEVNNITLEAAGEAIGKVRSNVSYYIGKEKLGDKVWQMLSESPLQITREKVMNKQQIQKNDTTNTRSTMYYRNQLSGSVIDDPRNHYHKAEPIPLEETYIELPYLPQTARAGLDAERYWQMPQETIRVRASAIPPGMEKKEWWIIKIDGDSMEPQLISGAKVLAYRVEHDSFRLIRPQVLAVQYGEEVVVKRIVENQYEEKRGFMLHSDNPPPNPYFVKADDIKQIWVIVKIYDAPVR
ncbi:S24 family peptidase [Larkinella sp. C7]|uniref:S24 family peptidase n=1 Tax=Larkinella sp. C7 TaxID=2576607 RepID=UPI0011114EA5|nr:S24 family peptidase [Larkinella sp. C7]